MVVLGIDAGGTRTLGLLADETGAVLASARGPGANLQSAGELEVEKVLHQVVEDALGDTTSPPSAICLGIAGVDRPGDGETIRAILARIGYRARVLVVNDALIALEAGLPGAPGIVMISGTGSIAFGRDAGGRAARAGGLGHVLSDEGSGYWLGREALRAVVRAADGRGPATALSARLLAHFQVDRATDLVPVVYGGGARPSLIAGLAREVEAAAEAGDAVAGTLIDSAAAELTEMAASVARQLDLTAPTILLSGGTARGAARLRQGTIDRLGARLPGCIVRLLEAEPAEGAVRLALAQVAGRAVIPTYRDPAS
jgi:N-acetylglucosamine kinase-like BadF-type ATPase